MITELLHGMDNLIEKMPDTITDWQTQADKDQQRKKLNKKIFNRKRGAGQGKTHHNRHGRWRSSDHPLSKPIKVRAGRIFKDGRLLVTPKKIKVKPPNKRDYSKKVIK